MTSENNCPKLSKESMATTTTTSTSATKQRKKRKWDQPAESFISAGLAVPGVLPFSNLGPLAELAVPGITSLTGALLTNPVPATSATITQAFQAPSMQQTTATVFQKLNLPKIQDELIAREIVINDAEPTIRYKLTKRQTQEEIQRCTGAVVITRGKYRPPNALPDSEKPLYLHISAGSHLKETAERIITVDHAAAMVEEMLKQGQNPNTTFTPFHSVINVGGQVSQSLSVCVFLGFDTDPSLNISSRIRGPNDQYINHIMNETGATVILRGRISGNSESVDGEDLQQPLHLFLSGNNPKSLEDANLLAENLLDTIAAECGASRISSSKVVYKAVPPPPQLLAGVQSSGIDIRLSSAPVAGAVSPTVGSTLVTPVSSAVLPGVNGAFPQMEVSQPGVLLGYGQPQSNTVCYPQSSVCGTSYSGYGGVYPQAAPLQQVALVRPSPSPGTFTASATSSENTLTKVNASFSTGMGKRPPQKRKFQELPVASKIPAEPHQIPLQRSEFVKPGPPSDDFSVRTTSSMPPLKKLVQPSSNGMPPPPPRTMPPPPSRAMPPPPLKLMSSAPLSEAVQGSSKPINSPSGSVPDTLIKLMEYGDDDDDDDDDDEDGLEEESQNTISKPLTAPKPFWAL